jgi:Zn-dependent peptidase ImmA (M78 family)
VKRDDASRMPGKDTNTGAKRARQTREAVGLDASAPLECVLALAEERLGVPVVVAGLGPDIAGSCWRDGDDRTLLWVNGEQFVPRQRFTLAHEVGHVRCGHDGALPVEDTATLNTFHGDPREVQANAFAAELLAPAAGVRDFVDREPDLECVVGLAAWFGISTIAALYRLQTLGLVTKPRGTRLKREIDDGLHHAVWDAIEVPERDDGLSRAHDALPYVSPAIAGSALAAALRGDASIADAARSAGCDDELLSRALAWVAAPRASGVRPA